MVADGPIVHPESLCVSNKTDNRFQSMLIKMKWNEVMYCRQYRRFLKDESTDRTDDFNQFIWTLLATKEALNVLLKVLSALIFILNASLVATFLLIRSIRQRIPNIYLFNQIAGDCLGIPITHLVCIHFQPNRSECWKSSNCVEQNFEIAHKN